MTVRTIDEIFRDFVTEGVPASGPYNPHKPDIRDTLKNLTEGSSNFPDNRVIRLNNANEGTTNNIVVSASVVIPSAAYQVLYILNVTQANTGPVTVSGAINRSLVTNTNQPLPSGYLVPGMALLCIDTGTSLRLLSYGEMDAIAQAAIDAANRAEAAAAGLSLPTIQPGDAGKSLIVNDEETGFELGAASAGYYDSKIAVEVSLIHDGTDYIHTAGYYVAGDGGAALYVKVSSEPAHAGKIQSADGAWWEYMPDNGRINVKCFGAKGDNTSDETYPLWNAIASVSYGLGHTVFIPAGRYLVSSTLGYVNTNPGTAGIAIEGEDPTTTILVYSGSGDCLSFTMGANTYRDTNRVAIRKLGILAADSKPAQTGSAISVFRDAVSSVTPGNLFEDLYIWQGAAAWAYGIWQTNSQESYFNRLYIMLINNEQGACVRIANSNTQSSFGAFFKDCAFNGGEYGLHATGWIESVFMEGCGWAGQVRPIFLDASMVAAGNPHFTMTNCHLNAKEHTIYTAKWRTIFITGCDLYSGVGSGDRAGSNLICVEASHVHVTGCKFDNGASNSYKRDGIGLNNVQQYTISGCTFAGISGTAIGVIGASSKNGAVTGNVIQGVVDGTPNETGIYIAGTGGQATVTGNVIVYFSSPASLFDSYCVLVGNVARECTVGYTVSGTGSISANNIG